MGDCPHSVYVSCWNEDGSRFCAEGCACACHWTGRQVAAVIDERDALAARIKELEEALRDVNEHAQVPHCDCVDLPRFSCCTCGAYEYQQALRHVDDVLRADVTQGRDGGGDGDR